MIIYHAAALDLKICTWREWEALIGLQTNKENVPFDIENKACYSQLLLLSFLPTL